MYLRRASRSAAQRRTAVIVASMLSLIAASGSDEDAAASSGTDAPPATDGTGGESEWRQLLTSLQTMPLDELYQHALEEEDGRVIFWQGNSVIPADRAGLGPAFEAAFPGMSVTLFGEGSGADMIARVAAERQAGLQPSGDLFWGGLETARQAHDAGIVAEWTSPEADDYPDILKGTYYVATDFTIHGVAWNTDLVSDAETPTSFEDLADPKWQGRIVAEPRIAEQLTGLAVHKFAADDEARAYAEALAANDITFVPRYPTLAQTLAAGEYDICFNCNAYNVFELIQDGAPLEFMETEAIALPDAQMIFADPLHPYGAMLMARWMISEEGQMAWAEGGRNQAHPNVQGVGASIVPEVAYVLESSDFTDIFPTWDDYAAELFNIR